MPSCISPVSSPLAFPLNPLGPHRFSIAAFWIRRLFLFCFPLFSSFLCIHLLPHDAHLRCAAAAARTLCLSHVASTQIHVAGVLPPFLYLFVSFSSCVLILHASCRCVSFRSALNSSSILFRQLSVCACLAVPQSNDMWTFAVNPNSSKFSRDMCAFRNRDVLLCLQLLSLHSSSIVTTSLLRRSPSIFGSFSFLRHGTATTFSQFSRSHLPLLVFFEQFSSVTRHFDSPRGE